MHSPVQGPIHIRGLSFSNIYGKVRKYPNGSQKAHQGWDISSPPGTPVYAITNGVIKYVQDQGNLGLGKQVCLEFDHKGKTLYAVYGHLQTIDAVAGMFVIEGEQLGTSGQTGNAHGQALSEAHLHLEIRDQPHAGFGLTHRLDPMSILGQQPVKEIIDDLFSGIPTF